jgi:hypothetical protein
MPEPETKTNSRQPYRTPELTVYGDALTLTRKITSSVDQNMSGGTNNMGS